MDDKDIKNEYLDIVNKYKNLSYLKTIRKKKNKDEDLKKLCLEHIDLYGKGKISKKTLLESYAEYEYHTGRFYDETLNEFFTTEKEGCLIPLLILLGIVAVIAMFSNFFRVSF